MKCQINSTTAARAPKRAADDELGGEAKKVMIEHHLQEKETSNIVRNSSDGLKFINASTMVNTARNNVQTIPEITDEELLAMTLEFEKKNPQ